MFVDVGLFIVIVDGSKEWNQLDTKQIEGDGGKW
jgi:hypothetical protein